MVAKFFKLSIILIFFLLVFTKPSHAQIYTTEKLITVDLAKQKLYAWEGGRVIAEAYVSTGLPRTPTPRGNFQIRTKVNQQDMKGGSKAYGFYYLKNVPNVMYFYRDYAIHGAYWHNNFGRRASHGCVNVPVTFSKWLFDWSSTGVRVFIF